MSSDDSGEKRFIPWVCIALLVANVGAFAFEIARGADVMNGPKPMLMIDLGGNFGPMTLAGEPWRLFTSMFLHFGLIHLAMNMLLGLFQLGQITERLYGHAGFAVAYVVAGLGGSLASAIRANTVSAGASGAVFGIVGAFGAFLIFHRKRFDQDALKKQLANLALIIGINIWLAIQVPGIDQAAHIGGLVTGFLVGLALEIKHRPDTSRVARAVLVGVLGVGAIFGASYAVTASDQQGGLDPATKAFFEAENEIMGRWDEIPKGTSNAEAARIFSEEIIPAWEIAQVRYIKAGGNNQTLLKYINLRREGWKVMVEGLNANDRATVERGAAMHEDAKRLFLQGAAP